MSDKFKTYLFSYYHKGAAWSVEVQATSKEDAKSRIAKMASANYDGELVAKIPATFGLLPRIIVAVQNAAARYQSSLRF